MWKHHTIINTTFQSIKPCQQYCKTNPIVKYSQCKSRTWPPKVYSNWYGTWKWCLRGISSCSVPCSIPQSPSSMELLRRRTLVQQPNKGIADRIKGMLGDPNHSYKNQNCQNWTHLLQTRDLRAFTCWVGGRCLNFQSQHGWYESWNSSP